MWNKFKYLFQIYDEFVFYALWDKNFKIVYVTENVKRINNGIVSKTTIQNFPTLLKQKKADCPTREYP